MRFMPYFPDLNSIKNLKKYQGKVSISGHESIGTLSGKYALQSQTETLHLTLVFTKGWKPKITKFSTWFLFTFVKVFKKWPTTYQWNAQILRNTDGRWFMKSEWKRKGKIMKD